MKVRRDNIEEAHELIAEVPELRQGRDLSHYKERVEGKAHLVLIASDQGNKIGFKVGYQTTKFDFYSWVGGVVPKYRRLGVAQRLLSAQESCVWTSQYRQICVKTSDRYPAMCAFLEKNSYELLEAIGDELVYRKLRPNKGFSRTPVSSAAGKPGESGGGAG